VPWFSACAPARRSIELFYGFLAVIDGQSYFERLAGISAQFDLTLRAIKGFRGSNEAVREYLADDLASLRGFLTEGAKETGFDFAAHWVFSEDGSAKYLDGVKAALPAQLETVLNRLRQNHLILLVTCLEAALKEIHRAILKKEPRLLKADRQIPLGRLTSQPLSEIIDEEIEREVQSLDRKSIADRAEYFDKRLNVSWFDGTIVPLAEPVFNLRNTILHEDPNAKVSESNLRLAQVVCFSLPLGCIMQAAVLFPDTFKWGNTSLRGMKEIMKKQGRIK